MQAGVIGLGMIGGGVAQCLQRAGQLSAIYDVVAESARRVPGAPLMSPSARDLSARSDAVVIAVLNGEQTLAVLSDADGVLAGAMPGQIILLLSTIKMSELEEAQRLCAEKQVTLLDCGVTNGPKSAENGLICLVGGSDADVARAKPVFDGFAQSLLHMGPPGTGMAAKIARNTTHFGCIRAGYEGAVIARHYGVDIQMLRQSLSGDPNAGGGLAGSMALEVRPGAEGNEQEARNRNLYKLYLEKDLRVAKEEAARIGIRLPMVEMILANATSTVGLEHPNGQPLEY